MWFSQLSEANNVYPVTCVVLVVIVFVFTPCASSFAGTPESRGFMDSIRNIWHFVSPPKDYYNLLVDDEIDISTKLSVKKYEFKNKYDGLHSVGIFLRNSSNKGGLFSGEYLKDHKFVLKVEINFYVNNSVVLSRVAEGRWSPFSNSQGEGLIFDFYKTPKDLPTNETIVCEVKIIEPDKDLLDTYGPARFYIRKESDE